MENRLRRHAPNGRAAGNGAGYGIPFAGSLGPFLLDILRGGKTIAEGMALHRASSRRGARRANATIRHRKWLARTGGLIGLGLGALVLTGCTLRHCEVRWGTEGFPPVEGGPRTPR